MSLNLMISGFRGLLPVLFFPLLVACGTKTAADLKAEIEANPPAWVPTDSTLMFGMDGSIWVKCVWKGDIYDCTFYNDKVDSSLQQAYNLCLTPQSNILIADNAQSGQGSYAVEGLHFLPIESPVHIEGGVRDEEKTKLSKQEFDELDIGTCEQKFVPSVSTD